ncbi:MAG: bifunctional folylpolyglutamate synthase/dihydrofolate synthase [Opitutales bacterium]
MNANPDDLRTYSDVRDFLFGLRNTGMKYGIDRMRRLVEALGHPERCFPIIHVAGTNGKGSTCASIESIYREAGYKTGMYTSPHLVRLNERVQVNRTPIPDTKVIEMTRTLTRVGNCLEKEEEGLFPSFFEFMTGMAFLHFKEETVDIGIIEVGLGGRLDATNVVDPDVTAITSIALDHTHILGDTLEAIAREKAGILKSKKPVVLGRIEPGPLSEIEGIAEKLECPIHKAADSDDKLLPTSNLSGSYQRINAATAKKCVELLSSRLPVSPESIKQGLSKIQWAGRWEARTLANGQEIILDSTHNLEGTRGLAENLQRLQTLHGEAARFTIIAGALGRDRAESLLKILAPFAKRLIWVRPNQPRASEWAEVSELWPDSVPAEEIAIRELFPEKDSINIEKQELPFIATGSIYLIGEISSRLEGVQDSGDDDLQDDVRPR